VTRATALIASVAALAIAGCGGSDSKSSSSTKPAAAGGGGEVKVSMKNIKYIPMAITVKAGQKITWKNDDPVAHTVTARSGADFDSGTVNSGGTFSFTPKKAGTIDYVCTIHPGQTGTITVSG
jgi:plastocyanin